MAEERQAPPPYGVWATFINSIARLSQGVPNRLDPTVFPGMAWTAQKQLMAGYRFLGLIDDNDKPTAAMHALAVPDEGKRKAELTKLVREHYAELFAIDLLKTTPGELDQYVTEFYGITGDTREKAVRFFLSALSYLEIPVSKLFERRGSSSPSATPRRRRGPSTPRQRNNVDEEEEDDSAPPAPKPSSGATRSIELASGGTLTLSATVDLFALRAEDRTFVFSLIDQFDEYERKRGVL